jgi:hypothetical protein
MFWKLGKRSEPNGNMEKEGLAIMSVYGEFVGVNSLHHPRVPNKKEKLLSRWSFSTRTAPETSKSRAPLRRIAVSYV